MWGAFVRHVSREEPATPLALARIAFGLTTTWMVADIASRGLVDFLWVSRSSGGGGYRDLGGGNWLVSSLGGPTPSVMHALTAVAIAFGVALTLGLGGRLTALGTLLTVSALTGVNSHAGGSYDELLENALWLLFLGPSSATLSVDCRLRTGAWHDPTPRWAGARYLLLFQLILMYWTTGLQKVSYHWVPGGSFDALYLIFQQPTWQRFDMRWVAWFYPFTQLGTAMSWCWEVSSPLWLLTFWFRRTRTRPGWLRAWSNSVDLRVIYAAIGAIFHLGLFVFMDVGPFSPISMAYYFAVFDPEEYDRFTRAGRPRTATAPPPPDL